MILVKNIIYGNNPDDKIIEFKDNNIMLGFATSNFPYSTKKGSVAYVRPQNEEIGYVRAFNIQGEWQGFYLLESQAKSQYPIQNYNIIEKSDPRAAEAVRIHIESNFSYRSTIIIEKNDGTKEKIENVSCNCIVSEKDILSNRIQWALDSVVKYVGNTTYKQETGTLRTGNTTEALEFMDCSEFAARFVQLASGLSNVPSFATSLLAPTAVDGSTYGGYLEFVNGSDDNSFTDIRPGDIFLWRNKSGGHVGVVESYSEPYVYVLEALTTGYEGSLNQGACSNCVRRSKYTRTGKALVNHGDGNDWKGYFRPIINN